MFLCLFFFNFYFDLHVFQSACLLQQSNTSTHFAEIIQQWYEEHDRKLEVLTWLPNSSDYNLIEYLWAVPEKRV